MKTTRIKSAHSGALVLVATALLSWTAAEAQTPRVSADGGPISKGIGVPCAPYSQTNRVAVSGPRSTATQTVHTDTDTDKPQLEPHPALPGADVTVERVSPSTVKYCITPAVFNSSDNATPAPLSLWLAPYVGQDLRAYTALHVTNRAPTSCSVQMSQPVSGHSSAKAPVTWCVVASANGPQPNLAVYLGVPDKKVFGGNLSTGRVVAGPNSKGVVKVTAGYAEGCRVDIGSAREVAPSGGSKPQIQCGGARGVTHVPKSTADHASSVVPGTRK